MVHSWCRGHWGSTTGTLVSISYSCSSEYHISHISIHCGLVVFLLDSKNFFD